ncbi:MAG: alpha/beta hydrolase [Sphingomonadales bacterium]|nr:alpha/beta hydrolase [Sphingomonadales bacterium]
MGKGPYPLSILIQGTGPNLRGSFVELIDRLSSEGIATLEYDKRGTGVSTGKYEENNDKLIADARMVLAAMMKRTDIDQRKITIIGHSQGAIIAPALAFENPQIAAIVNLAGGVGDGIDIVSGGMRQTLLDAGKKPEAIETLVNAVTKLVEAKTAKANDQILTILRTEVVNGFIANDFSAEDAKGALAKIDNDDLQQIAQLRLGTQLKSVAMPVLQVFGSLDPIVASKYFAVEASKLLAHNPKSKVVMLDGLSHWFVEGAVTGSAQENATLGGNANSPRLIALVATWLSGILAIDADVKSIP